MIIGIKEWLAPQISEHCPVSRLGRLILKYNWFKRPGKASTLTPKEGIVQEWITSAEDTIKRIEVIFGTKILEDVFNNRITLDSSRNASISLLTKSEYS